jgi:protein kinase
MGKFFQNSGVKEPYSAIMTAFSDLCDLVSQSEDFDIVRKTEIQNALGADCGLLFKVISNLSSVIIDATIGGVASAEVNNDLAYTKFKVACKHFLHAMTSPKHPVVMFIDDIQWMDEGSMHLINTALLDSDLKNILLVFAYRDEEAEMINTLSLPEKSTNRVIDLLVKSLDSTAVYHLLSSMTGSNSEETHELSALVWQKTAGNPFHVLQLIERMKRNGWLTQNRTVSSSSWTFDVDEIRKQVRVSESVATLLAQRAAELDPCVQGMCKIASLLGFWFDEAVLVGICSTLALPEVPCGEIREFSTLQNPTSRSGMISISAAVEEGLLEEAKGGYQFCHDKIQSCFQSMIGDGERARLHTAIGEWFLLRVDPESLYNAANHLNQVAGLLERCEERVKMAQLNLEASRYCSYKSAFVDSARFLRRAYNVLDLDQKIRYHPDLAFDISMSLANVELIVGNLDACSLLTREALPQCKDLNQIVELMLVDIRVLMTANEVDAAVSAINRTLKFLGVKVPSYISTPHLLIKVGRVKSMMRNKTSRDILLLPPVHDDFHKSAMRLLFYGSGFSSIKCSDKELLYYSLLAVELTLKHGLSPHSAPAFVMYAMLDVAKGDYKEAYRLGNLALAMASLVGCKEAKSLTLVCAKSLISHRFEPINTIRASFDMAMENAFESGVIGLAAIAWFNSAILKCFIGENLMVIDAFNLSVMKRVCEIGQVASLRWVTPLIQYVLNLQSHSRVWKDLVLLNGHVMEEAEYLAFALESNNVLLLWTFWLCKLQLAYHFGFYRIAASCARAVATYGKSLPQRHINVYTWYCFASSVGYELYGSTGKRCHLNTARKYHIAMRKLLPSPDCIPFLSFLDAQELASKKKALPTHVAAAYVRAINAMAEMNWVHMEALVNERLVFYLISVDHFDDAEPYFDRALGLYRDGWGSIAKYEWLKERSKLAVGRQHSNPAWK